MDLGLGTMIASGLGGLFGMTSQSSANAQNMELAQYQNEWNEKMWHMQNEYNTPKNQMARYMEAGLNPNLIYGSGSASAGNSTSTPTAAQAHVEPLTNGGFISDAVNNFVNNVRADRLADADVQNKESMSRYNDSKAAHEAVMMGLTELRAIGQAIDNAKSATERDFLQDTYDDRLKMLTADLRGKELSNESTELDNFYNSATMETRIELAKVQTRNAKATTQEIMSRTSLNYANAKLAAARINEVAANVVLINRKSYGEMVDNSFKISNFDTALSKEVQELTNLVLIGNTKSIENYFRKKGLDVSEHTPFVNSLFGIARAIAAKQGHL
ncbi:DNA pilot protein [Dipodfec virus UOA04_Rod_991]|nr:DNA pilot protein [Dipodfec virus UOA04_Rod_991]